MADDKRQAPALLPSPWTDFTPLRNPFTYSKSTSTESNPGSSFTSATSSPTCSPTSSPISAVRSHAFGPYMRRARSRSRNSISSRSPSSFRFSSLFLRRRPSAVDLALSEERSRCFDNEIERRGLGLMEPRPVDPIPMLAGIDEDGHRIMGSQADAKVTLSNESLLSTPQPRYVMGGIFEVMEGSA